MTTTRCSNRRAAAWLNVAFFALVGICCLEISAHARQHTLDTNESPAIYRHDHRVLSQFTSCLREAPECVREADVTERWHVRGSSEQASSSGGTDVDVYNQTHCCETHPQLNRMMRVLVDFFKLQGIRFWLDHGTLLGAIRHKGSIIPWDKDGDVAVLINDTSSFNVSSYVKRLLEFNHWEGRQGLLLKKCFIPRGKDSCTSAFKLHTEENAVFSTYGNGPENANIDIQGVWLVDRLTGLPLPLRMLTESNRGNQDGLADSIMAAPQNFIQPFVKPMFVYKNNYHVWSNIEMPPSMILPLQSCEPDGWLGDRVTPMCPNRPRALMEYYYGEDVMDTAFEDNMMWFDGSLKNEKHQMSSATRKDDLEPAAASDQLQLVTKYGIRHVRTVEGCICANATDCTHQTWCRTLSQRERRSVAATAVNLPNTHLEVWQKHLISCKDCACGNGQGSCVPIDIVTRSNMATA